MFRPGDHVIYDPFDSWQVRGNCLTSGMTGVVKRSSEDILEIKFDKPTPEGVALFFGRSPYDDRGFRLAPTPDRARALELLRGETYGYRPFQIGDRVFALREIDGRILAGATGTVVQSGGLTGVSWDETCHKLHDCGGHCPEGTGWYVHPNLLARLDAHPPIDLTQFLCLLKEESHA